MSALSCPSCEAPIDAEQQPIGLIVICPACLRTIVAATGRLATSADTLPLSGDQVKALKTRRAELRKAREVA